MTQCIDWRNEISIKNNVRHHFDIQETYFYTKNRSCYDIRIFSMIRITLYKITVGLRSSTIHYHIEKHQLYSANANMHQFPSRMCSAFNKFSATWNDDTSWLMFSWILHVHLVLHYSSDTNCKINNILTISSYRRMRLFKQ